MPAEPGVAGQATECEVGAGTGPGVQGLRGEPGCSARRAAECRGRSESPLRDGAGIGLRRLGRVAVQLAKGRDAVLDSDTRETLVYTPNRRNPLQLFGIQSDRRRRLETVNILNQKNKARAARPLRRFDPVQLWARSLLSPIKPRQKRRKFLRFCVVALVLESISFRPRPRATEVVSHPRVSRSRPGVAGTAAAPAAR